MNINQEMRFEAAYQLTRRVYAPKLEALDAKWSEDDMRRVGDAIAKASVGNRDFSRFDSLLEGDVPEIDHVSIKFSKSHLPVGCYSGPTNTYGARTGSWEEQRVTMYNSLKQKVPLLEKLVGSYHNTVGCTPFRVPCDDRGYTIKLMSKIATGDDGTRLLRMAVTDFGHGTSHSMRNKEVTRLWKHFEAIHTLLAEAMDFHEHCYQMFKSCRTLKALDEKWPEIGTDFRQINGINEQGKQLSVEVVDPSTVRNMNRLIGKANAEAAKKASEAA